MIAGLKDEMLRAARNQVLYREVNEKIADLNEAFVQVVAISGSWVCECVDEACAGPMELTLAEYEQVRAYPDRFAVLPGHLDQTAERVVVEHSGYVVVEKLGLAARFAAEHDPRARQVAV